MSEVLEKVLCVIDAKKEVLRCEACRTELSYKGMLPMEIKGFTEWTKTFQDKHLCEPRPADWNTFKFLRKKNNISQVQLAEMIQRDQATISRIENGEQNPSLSTINKLTRIYNLSDEDVLALVKEYDTEE